MNRNVPPCNHFELNAGNAPRLADPLDPRTDQERELVAWLGQALDLQALCAHSPGLRLPLRSALM